ncbi:hypothetical protein LIER_24114 [Lithospermum erythrorhizon]|uniref:Uncharacterized protein n=1 Tax=Lithospermum erythrorhizon TaxID=34254 RepID=A0AAV3R3M7_LITER
MGNCWTSTTSKTFLSNEESAYGSSTKGKEEGIISKYNGIEVKIKISKKKLQELVNMGNIEGLTIQQMIVQLMDVGNKYEPQHHKSWRPALQSIPETDEAK